MGTYPGWYDSEESLALADQLLREPDFDTAYGIWEELQQNIYTEIPAIKLGDVAIASYYSERIGGWVNQIEQGIPYWNLWLEQ
jgi:ABC-type transport system substrate-binding protein